MPDNSSPSLRSRLSLDGTWDFRFGPDGGWRTATVPNPWQAEFEDLRFSHGTAHYVRRFALSPDFAGREVVLRFGAVNYVCEASLNGRPLGRHEGGYLPFEFVVPDGVLQAENVLEVAATLPGNDPERWPDWPFAEIPHGKQSWYGPFGGIWQSVALEGRAATHIRSAQIRADLSGAVELDVMLAGSGADPRLTARILDPSGAVAGEADVAAGGSQIRLGLNVPRPLAWSPETPNLYRLELRLFSGGEAVDACSETFGFRAIAARDGRLYLNGEPLYLRGALDQDYYPDGICTPPSLEFLEDQVRKAKELGLNCLRCHIKVPDPRYYEVADRLGILVWTEIPNVERFTPRSAARLRETMEGILARDGNHPSIVAWTLINEDWGTRLVENPQHRAWLRDTFDWLKALDPTRLVVDNSACIPNFHVKSDLNDYHYYRALPERRAEWDRLTDEFAAGAAWTYSPHGDAVRTGEEPLVVSEFGVWGLPHPDRLRNADGGEPWWLETGQSWGDGAAYPHGMQRRFDDFHLARTFGSFDAFIDAVQWHQFRNLKYQIESMRAHASIAGYVITEFTDVHWEANGLLDLQRNPRAFHARFPEINSDIVIVPKLERRAYWRGETIPLVASVAAGGRSVPDGSRLHWTLGEAGGSVEVGAVAPLGVSQTLAIPIATPDSSGAQACEIRLALRGPDGALLAENGVEVALYAPRRPPQDVTLGSPDAELASYLAGLGYRIAGPSAADIVVCRGIDEDDVEAIRRGGRYLVLAGHTAPHGTAPHTLRRDIPPREQPFMRIVDGRPGMPAATHHHFPGLGVVERHGTMWRGDWITSFGWLRRQGPFAALPGGPLLDLSFDRVVPNQVLTGFQPLEFEHRVHAGVMVGWVHKNAATIGERPFGEGRLVATTFRLTRDLPGLDPVAATLMDALVSAALSGGRKSA